MKGRLWILLVLMCLVSCRGHKPCNPDRGLYPIRGIDISAHNGEVDFARVAADSIDFVLIKATEGAEFCDSRFVSNHTAAVDAGLKVGAYHFFRFATPGHIQAYHFLNTVAGREMDLPLAIDVEDWNNDSDVPFDEVREQLRIMVDVLKSNGYPVMIYTNKDGLKKILKRGFDDVPIWICSLYAEPDGDWLLWQHSHTGRVQGISGDVDLNTYHGDRAAWQAFMGD